MIPAHEYEIQVLLSYGWDLYLNLGETTEAQALARLQELAKRALRKDLRLWQKPIPGVVVAHTHGSRNGMVVSGGQV